MLLCVLWIYEITHYSLASKHIYLARKQNWRCEKENNYLRIRHRGRQCMNYNDHSVNIIVIYNMWKTHRFMFERRSTWIIKRINMTHVSIGWRNVSSMFMSSNILMVMKGLLMVNINILCSVVCWHAYERRFWNTSGQNLVYADTCVKILL